MTSLLPTLRPSLRHCFFVLLFYSVLFVLFFSPVLFYDSLLAPGGGRLGDGLLYHLAYFQSSKLHWDNLLAMGHPMTADPQVMSWYPPSLLLSFLPGAWNVFVVSAYVMASCFTYGYVYALTRSKFSSLVSGIVYGMCGFMMAHMGHTAMVHTAVWLPLIVWSLEMLRREFSRTWLVIGCVAVACCVLAGHLQIVLYSLGVSVAYAAVLGWKAPVGRWRFYLVAVLVLTLGLGLAALQLLPTAELARFSTRVGYSFSDFVSYSLPPRHLLLLLFPAVLGGLPHYGTTPYFGEWNLTEMSLYIGLLPLMLAGLGFVASRRNVVAVFWLCIGVLAILSALGDKTPLAYLAYQLPMVGKFRAPARHAIDLAFAFSVLAGLGADAIIRRTITRRAVVITMAAGAFVMSVCLLVLLSNNFAQYATQKGVANLNTLPWSNLAVGTPLVVFIAAAAALWFWQRNPTSVVRQALVVFVLVLDLGSFGWFYNWHDFSPRRDVLIPPASAVRYRDALRGSNQRMLSVRGTTGTLSELPPNLSRLWEVPNATGYGPLTLDRVTNLLTMLPDGGVANIWSDEKDQSLDLAAVRYAFLPRSEVMKDERGILWHTQNMDIWMGPGCDHPNVSSVRFDLADPLPATQLAIVSRLACSLPVKDGDEILRVVVTHEDGNTTTQNLVAGRDTSEWSYDCRIVTPQMLHKRANIFSSFSAMMFTESCEGHYYLAKLDLGGEKRVRHIELHWIGRAGAVTIEKMSLVNEPAGESHPISPILANNRRWRFVEELGDARIYENLTVKPRAWLAPETAVLTPDEILKTIKTSSLPDGRVFDTAAVALVEEDLKVKGGDGSRGSAQVEELTETSMQVRTNSESPAFLVTSDTYYPGWNATVDGVPVQLYRANYALRGVPVPAGQHVVRFEFRPSQFYRGLAITVFSLVVLGGILLFSNRWKVRHR